MTQRPVFLSFVCSLIGCLALFVAGGSLISGVRAAENDATGASPQASVKGSPASTGQKSDAASGKASAAAAYDGLPVLDPSRFFGGAAMGYASAKAAPQVMAKLFCYCGCDATDGHKHLIDCFTSNHGMDCHICQEEAVAALKLNRDHTPMAEIQRQIDEEFSHHYPFQEDTASYKAYKASRLWNKSASGNQSAGTVSQAGTTGNGAAGPLPVNEESQNDQSIDAKGSGTGKPGKSAAKPKVKPGFHVGNCCAADAK